jgi:hypothetical protein
MYSIRFFTLAFASARSCLTSTGPISLYTFAPSFSSSSSYTQTTKQIKSIYSHQITNPSGAEQGHGRKLGVRALRTSSFSPTWMVNCLRTSWFLEMSARGAEELGLGLRGGRDGFRSPLCRGVRGRGRARAFLDLAEGVGLRLEVALHLAYRSRCQCRRGRHGLPLLPPPPPPLVAGFRRGSVKAALSSLFPVWASRNLGLE